MLTPSARDSPSSGSFEGSPATAAAAAEAVDRPEPGLARGRWEAPSWIFYAIAIAALFGAVVWLATLVRSRKALS